MQVRRYSSPLPTRKKEYPVEEEFNCPTPPEYVPLPLPSYFKPKGKKERKEGKDENKKDAEIFRILNDSRSFHCEVRFGTISSKYFADIYVRKQLH